MTIATTFISFVSKNSKYMPKPPLSLFRIAPSNIVCDKVPVEYMNWIAKYTELQQSVENYRTKKYWELVDDEQLPDVKTDINQFITKTEPYAAKFPRVGRLVKEAKKLLTKM